jgi:hypothetical protein
MGGRMRQSIPTPLRRYARPALVVALVAACVWALVASWGDVADALPRVGWLRFVLSAVAALVAGLLLAAGWRVLLTDMAAMGPDRVAAVEHNRLGGVESVAVYSASQLGKYIPGSVWPVVAQLSLARRHGIQRRTVVAAFFMQLLLLLVSAIVVAGITLPWVNSEELRSRWWLVLLVLPACLLLVPAVQRRLLGAAGRLLRRDLGVRLPSHRALAVALVVSVATYVTFGLHLALLAWPLSPDSAVPVLVQSVGAFALAWSVGFVVVFAPAGLGVREVVLTVTMGSVLADADAIAVAVLSRTAIVLADLALGLFGVAIFSLRRELAAPQHHEDGGGGPVLGGLDVGDEAEDQDLGGDEQTHGGPDEAGDAAVLVAGDLQDEPAHHEHQADQAGDR